MPEPGFSFEAYGAFRSKPGCPEDAGNTLPFPKTKHWSAKAAPWKANGDFVNISVSITPTNPGYKKRTASVAGD